MVLLGDETVFVSVQDRCTVCSEHIRGTKIILDALIGDVGLMESRFSPFGDSGNLDARYVNGLR
jgi:hypothetical protein